MPKLPNIVNEEIWIRELDSKIKPWSDWIVNKKPKKNNGFSLAGNAPNWRKDYNKLKHNRTSKVCDNLVYEKANLENVLKSLAGLYILDLLLYSEIIKFEISRGNYEEFKSTIYPSRVFESVTINKDHESQMIETNDQLNGASIPFSNF